MIIKRNNHSLVEVACSIWFDPNLNDWDITYFGKFYDKIKDLGYNQKEEKKVIEIHIDDTNQDGDGMPIPQTKSSEVRMIFRNSENNAAIMLSNNLISFNKLTPYNGWDDLMDKIVNPCLKIYEEIGLGKGVIQVSALYLNKFTIPMNEKLINYFNFIPVIEDIGEVSDRSLEFQTHYDIDSNLELVLKLNGGTNHQKNNKEVFFECVCIAKNINGISTIGELSELAHQKARSAFIQLTNTK